MGRVLLWTAAVASVLLALNKSGDCMKLTQDSSIGAETQDQNETNSVAALLKKLANEIKSLFTSVKTFIRDKRSDLRNNSSVDFVNPLAKAFLNYTDQDLRTPTKDISNAVYNFFNNTSGIDSGLRKEADRIINSNSSKVSAVLSGLNIIFDSKLLNDTIDLLSDFPRSKNDLEKLVTGILNNFISTEYKMLNDKFKDKLIKKIDKLLKYFTINIDIERSNDDIDDGSIDDDIDETIGEAVKDNVKSDVKNFVVREAENIIKDATDDAIDELIEGGIEKPYRKKLGDTINIDKNIEISIGNSL